jgi:hypothetical protein
MRTRQREKLERTGHPPGLLNSPVAQVGYVTQSDGSRYYMVGSYNFATANGNGTWTVDWQGQYQSELQNAINVFWEQAIMVADKLNVSLTDLLAAQTWDPNSPNSPKLGGGNWNFQIPGSFSADDCQYGRCSTFGSLDFSHGQNFVHMDTANVFRMFGMGAIVHGVVDLLLGNTILASGIPR